ncbi:hypothetical protein ACE1TF_08705 [Geomicrobium sp. JSM 1781026]
MDLIEEFKQALERPLTDQEERFLIWLQEEDNKRNNQRSHSMNSWM